jgi:SAM-dependent methyltransferase
MSLIKTDRFQRRERDLLIHLRKWWGVLAKDVFRNKKDKFDSEDPEGDALRLKEITRRILDRIVFIRFCEDRKALARPHLNTLFPEGTTGNALDVLRQEFQHYHGIFGGDLFEAQEWESWVFITPDVLRSILADAYESHQFDQISLDILGTMHEAYFGCSIKIVKWTSVGEGESERGKTMHDVEYSFNSEERKVGGVYYTPKHIVDHIIDQTVRLCMRDVSLDEAKGLRIIDPACGSGNFLVAAYEYLLAYFESKKGSKLEFKDRATILVTQIFGVDLDANAVRLARLSLLLKLYEGQEVDVSPGEVNLNLTLNIQCGNTLVGPDIAEKPEFFNLPEAERQKINPFDWNKNFPEAMSDGGFDVIIGNPPYVTTGSMHDPLQSAYFKDKYATPKVKSNLYILFILKSISLLKPGGYFSFIVPISLLFTQDGEPARRALLDWKILEVNDVGPAFDGIAIECTVFAMQKVLPGQNVITARIVNKTGTFERTNPVKQERFKGFPRALLNVFCSDKDIEMFSKITVPGRPTIGDFLALHSGFRWDEAHNVAGPEQGGVRSLLGAEIERYKLDLREHWVDPAKSKETARLVDRFKDVPEKIVIRGFTNQLIASLDTDRCLFVDAVYGCENNGKMDNRYLLGVLNTQLLNYFVRRYFVQTRRRILCEIHIYQILELPVPAIGPAEQATHDQIVALVSELLTLHKTLPSIQGHHEKASARWRIKTAYQEVEDLVSDLYGLTASERRMVATGM